MSSWSKLIILFKKSRLIQIISGLIILLTFWYSFGDLIFKDFKLISNWISPTKFDVADSTFNILILPFERTVENKTYKFNLERKIQKKLQELSVKNNLKIEIIIDEYATFENIETEVFKNSQDRNAHLVIYGDFSELVEKELEIRLKWKLIKNIKSFLGYEGDSGDQQITSLTQITEGFLIKDPVYISTWALGLYDYFTEKYFEAMTKFNTLYNLFPDYADKDMYLNLYIANTSYCQQDWDKAELFYKHTLELDSLSNSALTNLGSLYFRIGKNSLAKHYTSRALELDNNNIDGLNNLALIEKKLGYYSYVKKNFLMALSISPEDPVLNYNYANYLSQNEHNYAESAFHYKQAIKSSPNFLKAIISLSKLYSEKINDDVKALEYGHRAYSVDSNDVFTLQVLAMIEIKRNNFNTALQYFKDALAVDQNNIITNQGILTITSNSDGEFRDIEEIYNKILSDNDSHEYAWINLASLMTNRKNFNLAEKYFNNAIKINPNNYLTYYFLGDLYRYKLKDNDRALKEYQKANTLNPTNTDILEKIADVFFNLKNYKKSADYLNKFLNTGARKASIHWRLGYLNYFHFNNIEVALKELRSAIKVDPNYAMAYSTLGDIYYNELGLMDSAKTFYLKSISLDNSLKNSSNDSLFNIK